MIEFARRNPFFLLLVGLITGILLGQWCGVGVFVSIVICSCGCLFWLVLKYMRRTPLGMLCAYRVNLIPALLISTAVGVFVVNYQQPNDIYEQEDKVPFVAVGEIVDCFDASSGNGYIVDIHLFKGLKPGDKTLDVRNLRVAVICEAFTGVPGQVISFIHDFDKISPSGNSQIEFYPEYMLRQGILYRQYIGEDEKIKAEAPSGLRYMLYRWRNNMETLLSSGTLDADTENFLIALMLGNREYLSPETVSTFRQAGMSHLLALSGLHIGVICMILTWLLFPMDVVGLRSWRYGLVILLLWAYIMLTGMSVSAVRAGIMATLCIGAMILQRKNAVFNALSAAAFIILLFDYRQLFQPGFQLSFGIVILMILSPRLNPIDYRHHKIFYNVCQIFIVGVLTLYGSLCLSAYYFHTIPLAGYFPNIIAVMTLPMYLGMGIAYLIFSALGFELIPVNYILNNGYDIISKLAEFASTSSGSFSNVWIHWGVSLALISVLIFALRLIMYRRKVVSAYGLIISVVMVLCGVIFLPTDKPKDGFIVQAHSLNDALRVYHDGIDTVVYIRAGLPRVIHIEGKRLLVVKSGKKVTLSDTLKVDFLLVGYGYNGDIASLTYTLKPDASVVLMQSLYDWDTDDLASEALRLGLKRHVIRYDGPLKVLNE